MKMGASYKLDSKLRPKQLGLVWYSYNVLREFVKGDEKPSLHRGKLFQGRGKDGTVGLSRLPKMKLIL